MQGEFNKDPQDRLTSLDFSINNLIETGRGKPCPVNVAVRIDHTTGEVEIVGQIKRNRYKVLYSTTDHSTHLEHTSTILHDQYISSLI